MRKEIFAVTLIVSFVVMLCGCESYNSSYYGTQSSSAYSSGPYAPRPVSYSRPSYHVVTSTTAPTPTRQTVVENTYSFTDTAATSASFNKELQQKTQETRERRINAFLRSAGMWGGSVIDTRDKFKVAIESADKKLVELRKNIVLSGGTVATDQRYIAAKSSRDNLNRKLQELDARIMQAIVNKSTGEVARQLIFRPEDQAAANAAAGNLQQAEQNYGNSAKEMLRQSNW